MPSGGETTPTVSLPGGGGQQSGRASHKMCPTSRHHHRVDFIQRNIEVKIFLNQFTSFF